MAVRPKAKVLPHPAMARRARAKEKARHGARGALREPGGVDSLRKWFEEKGVRKVKLGGFDIDGVWRGKYVSLDKFFSRGQGRAWASATSSSAGTWRDELYDNAKVTGWHTGYPDAHAQVDLSTGRIIPWEPDTAAFLLDFVNPDGSPFEASPAAAAAEDGPARAGELGFLPQVRRRVRVLHLQGDAAVAAGEGLPGPDAADAGHVRLLVAAHLRQRARWCTRIIDGCNAFGIEIEGMHTETGPGVYEAAIRYDDAGEGGGQGGAVQDGGEGDLRAPRADRLLHGQAERRSCRAARATCTSRCGR